MVSRRQFLMLGGSAVVAGGVMLAGCGATEGDPDAQPLIRYGGERCSYCTMPIDDPRFAAVWRVPQGAERHFDDIGCMVNALRREGPPASTRLWVHDYRSEEWMDAAAAVYLIWPSIKTPMAYGVAAFASAAEAGSAVPAAKSTLAWADVLSTVERKG